MFTHPHTALASACQWSATAASTTWANPANWSNCSGVVPQTTDTVEIITSTNKAYISTAVTIAGLTVTSGYLYIVPNGSLVVNGSILLTSGEFQVTNSQTVTLTGDWTNNGGTFTYHTSTVIFSNTSAQQNINGTAVTQNFYNITIDKTSQSLVVGGSTIAFNIYGSMTLTSGTFDAGTATTIVVVNGDWTNNGGTFTPGSSRLKFVSTTAQQNINGTAASQTFYRLDIDKTGQSLVVGGSTTTINITLQLYLTNGIFNAGSATQINISGVWEGDSGTFTPGTGNVTFNASVDTSITGSAASQTFYDVTIAMTAGKTLNVGSVITSLTVHNFTQTTGNFNAPATLTSLTLNNFTLSSGTFTNNGAGLVFSVGGNWTKNGATFTPSTGTVTLNGSGAQTISGSSNTTFYGLTLNNASGFSITSTTTPTVTHLLTLTAGPWTGNIIAFGDVTVATTFTSTTGTLIFSSATASQTLTGSGVEGQGILPAVTINKASGTLTLSGLITVDGAWTWTAGSLTVTGSTVAFYDNNGSGYTISGTHTLNNVTFANNHSYVSAFYIGASNTLTVSGTLAIKGSNYTKLSGSGPASSIINAQGDIAITNTFPIPTAAIVGGVLIQINGTGNQAFTGSGTEGAGVITDAVTINKASGNLTLTSIITVIGAWTFTSMGTGTLITTGSTVAFYDNNGSGYGVIGTETLNNVTFSDNNAYVSNYNITGLTIAGTLAIKGTTFVKLGGGGPINAQGNVTVTNTAAIPAGQAMSALAITLNGTGDQIVTGSGVEGGGALNAITINKASGNLTLSSIITVGNTWTFTSMGTGSLITTGSTVAFYDANGSGYSIAGTQTLNNVTFNNTSASSVAFTISSTLTVAGTLAIKGGSAVRLNTGVINAHGDITITNTGSDTTNGGGTLSALNINGGGTQTLTGSGTDGQGMLPNTTVNTGTLNLASIISLGGSWTWSGGLLSAGTSTLSLYGINGTTLSPSTVTYNNVSLSNAGATTYTLSSALTLSGTLTKAGNASSIFSTSGSNYTVTTGNLAITAGTFIANTSTINISGNFTNSATFTKGSSTLIFNGSGSSTINPGSSAFNNFTVNTASKALVFNKDNSTVINGILTLNGGSCSTKISLDSSDGTSQFTINATGTKAVSYVNVKNSIATTAITASSSLNSGNNSGWTITPCTISSPTSLSQYKSDGITSISTGGWTNETTIVCKFNMTSNYSSDSLTPQVEIKENGTAFTNAVTNSGTAVGYSGTPVTGTVTISGLSSGKIYYWQASVLNSETTSSWVAMGGNPDFGVDTTAPIDFNLDSPGGNSYTNSERPTFRWNVPANADATSGLSKYKLDVNNGDSGSFTIDNIPTSGTTDISNDKYVIHFDGFSDSDTSNNYISVYTKSSSIWGSDNNDGKVKEGNRGWQVTAYDNAGNTRTESRNLFVDRTGLSTLLTQINNVQLTNNSVTSFTSNSQKPQIFGKITDPLEGDKTANTIASGPTSVEVKVEKKNYFGFYDLYSLTTVNLNQTYWVSTGKQITDNTQNLSDKYSTFVYQPTDSLPLGTYKITLTGKDNAGNTGNVVGFNLVINTLGNITTPEEQTIINQGTTGLTPEQKQKVNQEPIITNPVTSPVSKPFSGLNPLFAFLLRVWDGIVYGSQYLASSVTHLAGNLASYIKETARYGMLAYQQSLKSPKEFIGRFGDWLSYAITSFGEIVLDSQPTRIYAVNIQNLTKNSVVITWKTNHLANSKVNYGLDEVYGKDIQSDTKVHDHTLTITGLTPDTQYFFEVMSQNKNYVYDANHKFTTPKK